MRTLLKYTYTYILRQPYDFTFHSGIKQDSEDLSLPNNDPTSKESSLGYFNASHTMSPDYYNGNDLLINPIY